MPSENSVDYFIESSSKLLAAYPTNTTLSITYANTAKKLPQDKPVDAKKATNKVTFKCYEPQSGKCIKYSTYKIKELSRLLTFIGPRGVLVTKATKKRKHLDVDNEEEAAKTVGKSTTSTEHKPGLASIMSNVKFEEEIAAVPAPSASTSTPQPEVQSSTNAPSASTASKNKKKKKGKK